MKLPKLKGPFTLILWNELRDLWTAIFPPAPIRERLGGSTSLTAILALFGFLLGILSVIFSYRSYYAGFAEYTDPLTAQIIAYTVSIFVGVFMLIGINLLMHNINESLFRWGNPIWSVILACLISCSAIGWYDMKRMQVGGNDIARDMVGSEASLIRPTDPEYLRQRKNYERLAAESLAQAAWCSTHRTGGKVIEQDGSYQVVCRHDGSSIAISGPGVNRTTKKAHTDHDHYLSQIAALQAAELQKDEDYRRLTEADNARKATKLTEVSGTFDNVTTYLYLLQALLSFFQFAILISAAKKAGVSLTGEAHTQPSKPAGSWAASLPYSGFAQAHHKQQNGNSNGSQNGSGNSASNVTSQTLNANTPTGAVVGSNGGFGIPISGGSNGGSHTQINGYEITCKQCGCKAVKQRKTAVYCSDSCRQEYHNFKLKS